MAYAGRGRGVSAFLEHGNAIPSPNDSVEDATFDDLAKYTNLDFTEREYGTLLSDVDFGVTPYPGESHEEKRHKMKEDGEEANRDGNGFVNGMHYLFLPRNVAQMEYSHDSFSPPSHTNP